MSGERRPIATREKPFFKKCAATLARAGFTPNQISLMSIVFGVMAGVAFATAQGWMLLTAALFIQGRLLCNLFDGMVAVEHGKGSPVGELFNEVPDRVSDTVILLGLGLRPEGSLTLAMAAALAAMFTAYVRTTGVAAGSRAFFAGPMAKQQRMFLLTLFAIAAPFLPTEGALSMPKAIELILWVITIGAIFTSLRRLALIAGDLRAKP